MLSEVKALIGGVNDDRILSESIFVEVVEHSAHAFIDCFHGGKVVLHVALVFPAHDVLVAHGREFLEEGFVLRAEVTVPSFFLKSGHTAVFHCRVAIQSG